MNDYTPLVMGILALVLLPLSFIVNAWILQVAARKTVNCFLPLGRACLITFAAAVAYAFLKLLQLLLTLTVMKWLGLPSSVLSFFFIVVGFAVGSAIYGVMVKPHEWSLPIGFRKGMLVWLVVSLINLAIAVALAVIFGAVCAVMLYFDPHP